MPLFRTPPDAGEAFWKGRGCLPILAGPLSNNGPFDSGRVAGAFEDRTARGLQFAHDYLFIDGFESAVFEHHLAVDDDRLHAVAVGGKDQVGYGVVERPPLGAGGVEDDDVGLLAWLE